jgi:hypothetical protein
MKNSTDYRFVGRDLAGLTEWVVRFAEILALTAVFLFVAIRTQSWMLWSLVVLLHLSIAAHLQLGVHSLAKRVSSEEARRTEAGENDGVVPSKRKRIIGLTVLGAIGFAFGAGTVWVVVQIVVANAS